MGTQVRQFAGEKFALVEGLSKEHKRVLHVLPAIGETRLIYEVAKYQHHAIDGEAAPVACFWAPKTITSLRCHGTTICVGCGNGAVCVLWAPESDTTVQTPGAGHDKPTSGQLAPATSRTA